MPTRYYYTDPLAAAWMTKHFGMRFLTPLSNGLEVEPTYSSIVDNAGEAHYADFEAVDKFYIHPDSLHLLEPQVGDVVWCKSLKMPMIVADENIEFYSSPKTLRGEKILSRGGVPFMWPEGEEA